MAAMLGKITHGGQLDEGHCGTDAYIESSDRQRPERAEGCSKGLTGRRCGLERAAKAWVESEKLESVDEETVMCT